jgi:hypothetical protein
MSVRTTLKVPLVSNDVMPPDQSQFISNLLESFEHYSDQSNVYFQETINFLDQNYFLDPLVCSLRAIMNQGFTSFPDFTSHKQGKSI